MDSSTSDDNHRCAWIHNVFQCRMSGTIGRSQGRHAKFYCTWHIYTIKHPADSFNKDKFVAFVKKMRENPMAEIFKSKGLPVTDNEWDQDMGELMRRVGINAQI